MWMSTLEAEAIWPQFQDYIIQGDTDSKGNFKNGISLSHPFIQGREGKKILRATGSE